MARLIELSGFSNIGLSEPACIYAVQQFQELVWNGLARNFVVDQA
jgi:hypothetical protein